MADIQRFTKSWISSLPYTESGNIIYQDDEVKHLQLAVGKRTKTFYFRRGDHRVKLGNAELLPLPEARRQATALLAVATTPKSRTIPTLDEAVKSLCATRTLRPRTKEDYTKLLPRYLEGWLHKRLDKITRDMVVDRYQSLVAETSPRTANNTFRTLRAVFNFAKARWRETGLDNPVDQLRDERAWRKDRRKQRSIDPRLLPKLRETLLALPDSVAKDKVLTLYLTGMRLRECGTLLLTDVNLKRREILVRSSEAKNDNLLRIYITDQLMPIVRRRLKNSKNGYLFPSVKKPHTFLYNVDSVLDPLSDAVGERITAHRFRATYIAVGNQEVGIHRVLVKELVNHKLSDVTDAYMAAENRRRDLAAQEIADYLLPDSGAT